MVPIPKEEGFEELNKMLIENSLGFKARAERFECLKDRIGERRLMEGSERTANTCAVSKKLQSWSMLSNRLVCES